MGRKKSAGKNRKYNSIFNDVEFEEDSNSHIREETKQNIIPYYILQIALGWNESNPPRFTKNGLKLYSYRNKFVSSKDEKMEKNLQLLQDKGLIEPIEKGYKVTSLGISTLEKKFNITVIDDKANFKKKQEYNLTLLKQLKSKQGVSKETTITPSSNNKNKRGRPKKIK